MIKTTEKFLHIIMDYNVAAYEPEYELRRIELQIRRLRKIVLENTVEDIQLYGYKSKKREDG